MVMKKIIKGISLALMLMCVTLISGCGDDEGLPFWISSTKKVIDYSNPLEDGVARIDATVFDSKGNPAEDGTMYFTLSGNSAGTLYDPEEETMSRTVGIDLEDGVAEVFFYAGKKNETVVITAHCPGYPNNGSAGISIVVKNGSSFWVSSSKPTIDLSSSTDYKSTISAYVYETSGAPVTTGNVTFSLGGGVESYFKDGSGTPTGTVTASVSNGVASTIFYAANTDEFAQVTASYPGRNDETTTLQILEFLNTVDFSTSVKITKDTATPPNDVYTVTFTDTSKSGPTPDDKIIQWDWIITNSDETVTIASYPGLGNGNPLNVDMSLYKNQICKGTLRIYRQGGPIGGESVTKNFLVK